MRTLNLDILKEGIPGITPAIGAFMHEAILVAMAKHKHQSGVVLKVGGAFEEDLTLLWKLTPNKEIISAWKNEADIASYAAVGLSLLLMISLTNYKSFELAEYGTGIDYWMDGNLSIPSKVFQRKARLEISGIFNETTSNSIQMRINVKKKQIKKSDSTKLSAWIAVVAFNSPKSKIEKI